MSRKKRYCGRIWRKNARRGDSSGQERGPQVRHGDLTLLTPDLAGTVRRATRALVIYAQEKPALDGHPPAEPQGREGPLERMRKLLEDMAFFTSGLSQSGHCTGSLSLDEVVSTSNCFVHFLHTYSKIGMILLQNYTS